MIYVTRREVFSASHRLFNEEFSDQENEKAFDKCGGIYGHGHNYVLEVVVAGEINPKTGYVIDLKILKNIIRENIVDKMDHKHLNYEVDFMKDVIPTAENIALSIWQQLETKIPSGNLFSIKIFETENNYVEYRGE